MAGMTPGSIEGLRQFEQAAAIRSAFFGGPDNSLQIAFDVTPLSLDGDAVGVTLASDGQQVAYSQGYRAASRPVALTWPGTLGFSQAELSFQPEGAVDSVVTKRGLWGIFHLLDTATVTPLDAQSVRATFSTAGRTASFQFHVDTPVDPFDLKTLRAFHCPKSL